jgi:rhodanese-related sulfurtransferase
MLFITDDQLMQRDPQAIMLIDVRQEEECKQGMLPHAINIPAGKLLMQAKMGTLRLVDEKEIILYCQSGARAMAIGQVLEALGKKITIYKGGIEDWVRLI